MKEKLNIQTVFPILGLVLLLLLSPCKVRNFIQAELGVPQTEVTSKNQSSFNNYGCNDLEISTNSPLKESAASQHLAAVSPAFESPLGVSYFSNNYLQPHISRDHSSSTVPLYILYQNFKNYL